MSQQETLPEICICMGSSCFARGNSQNLAAIRAYLEDVGMLEHVALGIRGCLCMDKCKDGPMISIDGVTYDRVDPNSCRDLMQAHFPQTVERATAP
ncbi:MAG: (2Fe-2S) ferredoxin domain-containing protein [Lentisphaerae bacterium]|jgi:NADH:ubiquinone oxidoreductase subunit E|nr:(2Fe-2S) ferredoxin domain-containing protein [Lentisphaerota bacterium]MBT4818712.1 (2Fe-2S) ferredoxin domain-containing protein [Lentisphaerota bacterium]MBT5611546.1 (2Fe-2S) ferredoxin domain-containing protein [Lentisphaerota bacterium]MBT7059573.1 (2Fe-2S) ferredoxin domain-containing protein [Lentisphaerota bacterium]MBT7844973.1 (2Fe-2S) ferredoxin domain-containing protein [Lentisphaerota bacterium]